MGTDFAAQSQMTDAANVSRHNLSRTVPGMAHFAGTGPFGEVCESCSYWQRFGNKKQPICEKYRTMTGDAAKAIPAGTPSCRYCQASTKRGSA